MKNRKMKTWMLMITVVLATVTGCGDAGGTPSLKAEKPTETASSGDTGALDDREDSSEENLSDFTQSAGKEIDGKEDDGKEAGGKDAAGKEVDGKEADGKEAPEAHESSGDGKPEDSGENDPAGSDANEKAYLIGNVKSIGSDSIVVSKYFTEGEDVMVAPAEGSSDETLVTVYISEATQYEVKTVKNSGVNGDADVERRAGSFSDLKESVSVEITGCEEGESIRAERITIRFFV